MFDFTIYSLAFVGAMGIVDVLLCRGAIGVVLSTLLPYNK